MTEDRGICSIADVPRLNLCTSCGGCAGVCPRGAIELRVSRKGTWVPVVDPERCNDCGLCLRVCPGHGFDFPAYNRAIFGRLPEHPEVGNFQAIYAGYACDDAIRWAGQSGGVASALLIYLLEKGEIDGAVVTRWSRSDPLLPETFIARTREEILQATGSKYCPVPAASAIGEILRGEGRVAFVGTSCQVHAMRKAEALLPKLREKVRVHLGLFCLNVFNLHYHDHILGKIGLRREEVAHFAYRSKVWRGWPCDMRITTRDGRAFDLEASFSRLNPRPFFSPWRCGLCPDKLNEMADVSLGDCRVTRVYGTDSLAKASYGGNPGTSDVIARTAIGLDLIERTQREGVLALQQVTWEEILTSTVVSDKKLGLAPGFALARAVGWGLPDYRVEYRIEHRREERRCHHLRPWTVAFFLHFLLSDVLSGCPWYRRLLRWVPHRLMGRLNSLRARGLSNRRFKRSRLTATYRPTGQTGRPTACDRAER